MKYFKQNDNIALRSLTLSDYELIVSWINDSETTQFMFSGRKPVTINDVKKDYNLDENIIFMIVNLGTDETVGVTGLYSIDWMARKAEYRIILGCDRGLKIGTQATDLVVDYAFNTLNLHRVWLGVTSKNIAGVRAYEKAGFIYEGTLKHDLFRNGVYYDTIRMARLACPIE